MTVVLAIVGYAAYGKTVEGYTWDGRVMPSFADLTPKIQTAWSNALEAGLESIGVIITPVHNCSSCYNDHEDLVFYPLPTPYVDELNSYTKWAACPMTGEILYCRVEDGTNHPEMIT